MEYGSHSEYKDGLDRKSIRDTKIGREEADKRRVYYPALNAEIGALLEETAGITRYILHFTGSVGSNMCNEYSDIDLEVLVPDTSDMIKTTEFTDALNKRLDIPYNVHIFPIYVGDNYFEGMGPE